MKVLAEIIGGAQKVLTIGGNPSIPELAALAAGSADRSLTDEEGQELNWILYVPNGKGGFAPASRDGGFDDIETHAKGTKESDTFAGPGQAEGEEYDFRIRLFVPTPRLPVHPTDSGPVPIDDEEEVIDLTNIDADSGDLVGLRRVRKKRRRKKTGETTDPGRPKRRRGSGKFPTIKPEGSETISEIGPAAATEADKPSLAGQVDLPHSDAEMTFSEGVAFDDGGTSEEDAFELTIGDGTLGPAGQDAEPLEAHPGHVDNEGAEDAVTENTEETETAAAIPAVSIPAPAAETLPSTSEEEEVLIGSTTVDHEDVELSIPPDTIHHGVQAPSEDDNDNPSETDEDHNDGPPTQPQITLPVQGEDTNQSPDLIPEPDDQAVEAPTTADGVPDSEEVAAASDADAPALPTEATAPKKKRRRKKKKKPPPSRKAPIVGALVLLVAAIIGLIWLLYSRGVI